MTHQRHRILTVVSTLALAASATPAAATASPLTGPHGPQITSLARLVNQDPAQSHDLVSAGPCSEVCSGGAASYGSASQPTWTPDESGATLPHDPRPRSVAAASLYSTANAPSTAVRIITHGGGFDWGDAGIGAAGILALTLIALGGAFTATHRRNHRTRDQHAG